MKRLFTISVLSVLYVVGASGARADNLYTDPQTVFGTGSNENFNVATVGYVEAAAVPKYSYNDRNTVLVRDRYGEVTSVSAIDQGQVSGLTDALAGKVDDTQIANADATVPTAKMDTMVPTVQHMANAIADAVSTGVGAVDLSSRVAVDQGSGNANKVMVTGADGKVTTATTITQAQVENLSTDLAAKFDEANVIGLSEVEDLKAEDLAGKVYGADAVYFKDLILSGVISGQESIPYDIMHEDGSIITTLETPDKHSLIDGINSVYDVVKTNKTDIGNKVDKAEVIKADGTTTLAGTTVDATTLDKDTVAPTIANVEANFIPNVSDSYVVSTDSDYWGEETKGKAPAGSYIITVDVDENGKATYHWVAYSGTLPA